MAKPGIQPSLNVDSIVEEAFSMINDCGLDSFSVRSLAKRLGTSPMSLYTYFPSKNSLLERVFMRLSDQYDSHPVPGESWDDTVRRLSSSIRSVDLKYPEIYRAATSRMPKTSLHARRIYQLHKDQGMPLEAFRFIWCTVEAFLLGFVHQEILKLTYEAPAADEQNEDLDIVPAIMSFYSEEGFILGLDYILDGVKKTTGEVEQYWVTPLNPEDWTWT